MTDRRNISPADELGHIRAEMKRLKAREAELKDQITETGQTEGADFTVRVVEQTRRTLNREALPPEILEDDRYWKVSISRVVKTVQVESDTPTASLIDDDDPLA
ncbi:MAG: hypothetical protein AAFN27_00800 [Pseudomonadota bacterium]